MGLSYRKSFKVGNNTKVNLSKNGGIGVSTGVKGARVSVNKQGVRTTLNKDGVQYRKDYSAKNKKPIKKQEQKPDVLTFCGALIQFIQALLGLAFWGALGILVISILVMFIKAM